MWPTLTFAYYRLAMREEGEVSRRFPKEYAAYRRRVPAFVPRFSQQRNSYNETRDHDAIGCVLPFLLIFILPALGVSNDVMLVIFIVLMLGCHLFMGHASHGKEHNEQRHKDH